mmetsp:Transcript_16940/g.39943  ORF Transcript_16940/g.39943 Transcript_16940/m.39943 type:complete len:210 (-) Transcript_16940:777-1406(-)
MALHSLSCRCPRRSARTSTTWASSCSRSRRTGKVPPRARCSRSTWTSSWPLEPCLPSRSSSPRTSALRWRMCPPPRPSCSLPCSITLCLASSRTASGQTASGLARPCRCPTSVHCPCTRPTATATSSSARRPASSPRGLSTWSTSPQAVCKSPRLAPRASIVRAWLWSKPRPFLPTEPRFRTLLSEEATHRAMDPARPCSTATVDSRSP